MKFFISEMKKKCFKSTKKNTGWDKRSSTVRTLGPGVFIHSVDVCFSKTTNRWGLIHFFSCKKKFSNLNIKMCIYSQFKIINLKSVLYAKKKKKKILPGFFICQLISNNRKKFNYRHHPYFVFIIIIISKNFFFPIWNKPETFIMAKKETKQNKKKKTITITINTIH